MASRDIALRDGLEALARHELADAEGIEVDRIARAGSGNSSENWFFEARWRQRGEEQRHRLVLRRSPENEIVRNSRVDEFLLLKALDGSGLPVPRVFWIDRDGRWLGRPSVVLARCVGSDDRALLTAQGKARLDEASRAALADALVALMARLHGLDVDTLDLPPSIRRPEGPPALVELDKQEREALADELAPCIEMRLAAWWLRDNPPPPPARRVLVHGDLRPANLLVEAGRITALLDWEFAHVGDPAEELGWYLAPRYAGEHFIPGRWEKDALIAAYQRAGGAEIGAAALAWWAVFAQYKLCAMVLAAQKAFADGDAERIAVGADTMFRQLLEAVEAADKEAR